MPVRWYMLSGVAFIVWGAGILALAQIVPGRTKLVEFIGTLLTLLPVMLDLIRKYYVARNAIAHPETPFGRWVQGRLQSAFLGYEPVYALAVFLGVSLIALGFAMDLVRPGGAG